MSRRERVALYLALSALVVALLAFAVANVRADSWVCNPETDGYSATPVIQWDEYSRGGGGTPTRGELWYGDYGSWVRAAKLECYRNALSRWTCPRSAAPQRYLDFPAGTVVAFRVAWCNDLGCEFNERIDGERYLRVCWPETVEVEDANSTDL